jgi:DNA polymerase-3 subunit alpha
MTEVAERCNVDIPLGAILLPDFPTEEGDNEVSMPRRVAEEGLRERRRPVPRSPASASSSNSK